MVRPFAHDAFDLHLPDGILMKQVAHFIEISAAQCLEEP
jgi:hypothetical protein